MNEVLKTIAAKYKDDIVHTASELIQRRAVSSTSQSSEKRT